MGAQAGPCPDPVSPIHRYNGDQGETHNQETGFIGAPTQLPSNIWRKGGPQEALFTSL